MRKITAGEVFSLREKTGCGMVAARHELTKEAMREALADVKSINDLVEIITVLVEAY